MNWEERLSKLLDGIESSVRTSSDFVAEQAPMVVQELIAWKFWSAVVIAGVFAVLAIIALTIAVKARRYALAYKPTYTCDERGGLMHAFAVVMALAFLGACGGATYWSCQALKTSVAPRLVVLEEIGNIVRAR